MNGAPSTSDVGGKRLPKQVQARMARAAALQAQNRGESADPSGEQDDGTNRGSPPAAAPSPAATPQAATPPVPPAGVTDGAMAPSPATPPASDGAQNGLFQGKTAEHWAGRYTSTLGVLRAERAQNAAKIDELSEQLAESQMQLAQAKAPKAAAPKLEDYLSAEQIASLGDDKAAELLALAHRVAQEQVQTAVAAAIKPLQDRDQRRITQQANQERVRVLSELSEAVPDWEAINASELWKDFCLERDSETGEVRQEVIKRAMASHESGPLIALFRKFEKLQPPPAVPPGSAPPVQPRRDAASGNNPPATPSPADDDADGGPISRDWVKKAYTDLAIRRDLSDKQRAEARTALDAKVKRAQEAGQLR